MCTARVQVRAEATHCVSRYVIKHALSTHAYVDMIHLRDGTPRWANAAFFLQFSLLSTRVISVLAMFSMISSKKELLLLFLHFS